MDEYDTFFQNLASKLEIYDPIDRDIPEDDDQTIKRLNLLNRILNMDAVQGQSLNAPLSNKMHLKLEQLISNSQKRCNDVL